MLAAADALAGIMREFFFFTMTTDDEERKDLSLLVSEQKSN